MKTHVCGGTAPSTVIIFDTRWRCVVSFTHLSLNPGEGEPIGKEDGWAAGPV